MTTTAIASAARPLQAADLRGLTQLGFDAALGITDLVEAMHHTIVSRAGIVGAGPSGRTRGITGLVYGTVRGTTRLVGRGLDAVLGAVTPPAADASSPTREVALAVLNGVWGDHLAASSNRWRSAIDGGRSARAHELAVRVAQPSAKLPALAHGPA
jgi:hypothetical protein